MSKTCIFRRENHKKVSEKMTEHDSVTNEPNSGMGHVATSENFREKITELRDAGRFERYVESINDLDCNIEISKEIIKSSKDDKIKMKMMEQMSKYIIQREEMLRKISEKVRSRSHLR